MNRVNSVNSRGVRCVLDVLESFGPALNALLVQFSQYCISESHLCQINCLSLNEANVNRRLISTNCRSSRQSPRGGPNLFIKPSA